MIFVDPKEIEAHLPQDLRDRLKQATDDLMALPPDQREQFIDNHSGLWSDAKRHLAKVLGRGHSDTDFKCWYCEEKASRFDYHVDHFRPKGRVKDRDCQPKPGYWWLAFDYRNYRLSCAYCNTPHRNDEDHIARGKWDQFPLGAGSSRSQGPHQNVDDEIPLLIDPCLQSQVGWLWFDAEGKATPTYDEGFGRDKAARTIEILNLNDARVKEARKQILLDCKRLVDEGNEEMKKISRTGSPAAQSRYEDICRQIREKVRPHSEFSAMACACLRGTGQVWVQVLLTR